MNNVVKLLSVAYGMLFDPKSKASKIIMWILVSTFPIWSISALALDKNGNELMAAWIIACVLVSIMLSLFVEIFSRLDES